MRAAILQPRLRRLEPHYVTVIKATLYAGAIALYATPLSSPWGVLSAVTLGWVAMVLAKIAHRRHMRLGIVLPVAIPLLLAAVVLGEQPLRRSAISEYLGHHAAFIVADVVTFGLLALAVVFMLRFLAHRVRVLSLLEVVFVTGAVVATLADHRNRMLNRPRFLSDWAWSLGIDPTHVLVAIGAAIALLSALLFLREQTLLKLMTTVVLLVLLGALYYGLGGDRVDSVRPADSLGLSGKGRSGKAGKGRTGSGGSPNPFKDNYNASTPAQPVAVAILRDDLTAAGGVIYFRQRVLSDFNGVHLTANPRWDRDVITKLPSNGGSTAQLAQQPEAHSKLPTTMLLLVDHPQPPALTHAQHIELITNPNPRQFVAAYDVQSQVLSVAPRRLVGRASIPGSWSKKKAKHYTTLPDDPRYQTLADAVVRDVDPRFADDDLARAFAIKRYLEREGFYTRSSTHASKKDPTASFLFGNLRGYCVHFAHAAVYLMRSQGIAARVALGYAVQTAKRTGGSTILIMSDRAHAWPELHLEGVGWVSFDIYPERTDMPLVAAVDYDLEKMLGELARHDRTAGVVATPGAAIVPWGLITLVVVGLCCFAAALLFAAKVVRQVAPILARDPHRYARLAYVAVLDRFCEIGQARRSGETRERYAARLAAISPNFVELTAAHLGYAFGSARPMETQGYRLLVERVQRDFRRNVRAWRRLVGLANPISWLWTS